MAEQPMIAVEGLAGMMRALRDLDEGVQRQVKGELIEGAQTAAEYAVFVANANGLKESGDLIASIKAGFNTSYAYIRDTATRSSPAYPDGFNYPAIYEYGGSQTRRAHGADWQIRTRSTVGVRLIAMFGRGSGHAGPRAFLYPAAVAGEDELAARFERLLDRVGRETGLTVTAA